MPAIYHIGIDEAGYGPNLGPLVMSAVVWLAPRGDLWEQLTGAVRRGSEPDDGRPLVADSKLVYSPGKGGLGTLEKSLLPLLWPGERSREPVDTLARLIAGAAQPSFAELRKECWFRGQTPLPVEADKDEVIRLAAKVRQVAGLARVRLALVRSVIVCPPRFNILTMRWDSKAAVLGLGLADLVASCTELPGREPFEIVVDKHGGRNSYCDLLQHAFPDGLVLPREEGANRSSYDVQCLSRPVHFTFMPRAEEASFSVALASMVSKYLRELLMLEFNQFWQGHVPDLKPTAGYPVDAERFYGDIAPAAARLGITREMLWRIR